MSMERTHVRGWENRAIEGIAEQGEAAKTGAWPERWLSTARLSPYLASCDNDIERALDIHWYNIHEVTGL